MSWASPVPKASTSFGFDGAMAAWEEGVEEGEDNGARAADKTIYATGTCSWRRRAEDKCRRSGTATGEESLKKKRTIGERLILVSQRACWGQWTCGCSRVVRTMMSKGGFVGQ